MMIPYSHTKTTRSGTTQTSGFTLIETILYMAIVGIFLSGAVLFAWNIVYTRAQSDVQVGVTHDALFLSKRVSYELSQAQSILSTNSSSVCLEMQESERNPTQIALVNDSIEISWGGGEINCSSFANTAQLSAPNTAVTDGEFLNLSRNESENIRYSFTVGRSASRAEFSASVPVESSVELPL